MTKTFNVRSINLLDEVSAELLRLSNNRIFVIEGKMGVGKTTLIKSFCKSLNVIDFVSSPTFSIVNEYMTENKEKIFHFDLYRLNNVEELDALGLEMYLDSGSYCFLEWPELAQSFLPKNYHTIKLTMQQNNRTIELIK